MVSLPRTTSAKFPAENSRLKSSSLVPKQEGNKGSEEIKRRQESRTLQVRYLWRLGGRRTWLWRPSWWAWRRNPPSGARTPRPSSSRQRGRRPPARRPRGIAARGTAHASPLGWRPAMASRSTHTGAGQHTGEAEERGGVAGGMWLPSSAASDGHPSPNIGGYQLGDGLDGLEAVVPLRMLVKWLWWASMHAHAAGCVPSRAWWMAPWPSIHRSSLLPPAVTVSRGRAVALAGGWRRPPPWHERWAPRPLPAHGRRRCGRPPVKAARPSVFAVCAFFVPYEYGHGSPFEVTQVLIFFNYCTFYWVIYIAFM